MSTPPSKFEFLNRERERRRLELVKLFAPRRPMAQLPDQYRVTAANPEPSLIHFAIPIHDVVLYQYAEKHNLNKYYPCDPDVISPTTLLFATDRLSEEVQYELELSFPFDITADCDVVLSLYSNYTMEEKMLIDEDQEDVIQLVQEELGLDKSVRPKWYFDADDPWDPEEEDRIFQYAR
ncbi:hypothetical protein OG21DRAFT_1512638 [Imleria badia]|nr:hypothetical protein OG21DRAFT_1512638 [Imleria badia]